MRYRPLGTTGIRVSELSFGAGPIPALLTGFDEARQTQVVEHALRVGINWFDTAAGYGDGRSEQSLGAALQRIGGDYEYHIASKVRLLPHDLSDVAGAVERSVTASLQRLQVKSLDLLQLHNSVTPCRGDLPTSLAPHDVLGTGGVLNKLTELQAAGLIRHLGITGIGNAQSLAELIASGSFATMQVPYNLLNPSAGRAMPAAFTEVDYGNTIALCRSQGMGVFAIRVFAGGAIFGHPPSAHTHRTKFFPLDLYERDCRRAEKLRERLHRPLPEMATRYCLGHSAISSCIIGFSAISHVDEAVQHSDLGSLSAAELATIEQTFGD